MIPVKELRIGNWVIINGQYIHMDLKMFHAVLMGFEGYIPDPIPLTAEMLEKCGFIKHDIDSNLYQSSPELHEKSNKDIGIVAPSFFFNKRLNRWMDCQTRVCIDSLHQLQNLYLDLTSEELEIKL